MRRAAGVRSGAGEAAAAGRRGLFAELDLAALDRLQVRLVGRRDVLAALSGGLLHRSELLGRQVACVLLLDPAQPLGAFGGLAGIDLDTAFAAERSVDLL